MISLITASVFLLFSVLVLIYFVGFMKVEENRRNFRKYYIALAGVYLSATLLIWIISLINRSLPVVFVIVSGISISFVFCCSYFTVNRLMRNMDEIRKEIESKRNNESGNEKTN